MGKFLTEVMMVCVLGVGLASANTAGQPEPNPPAQSQVAGQETNGPVKEGPSEKEAKQRAKSAKKQAKDSSMNNDCSLKEGDPQEPQNTVEYGGGG